MRLKTEIDVVSFLEDAKKCIGDVFFHTEEGDILNLKSLLSEYVLVSIICNPKLVENARIVCIQDSDYQRLTPYLLPEKED